MQQIPGCFAIGTISVRHARGVEAIARVEPVRANEARIDPRRERALEISDEWPSAAHERRERERRAREVRLNRPAEEGAEARVRHPFRLPLARELGEPPGAKQVGEKDLGNLEKLVAAYAF